MCTAHGLALVKLPLGSFNPDQQPAQGASHDDCAYCPLLNALTALLICAILILPQVIGRITASPVRTQPPSRAFPGSLGARGPPLMA
jgi:hypothetical protein